MGRFLAVAASLIAFAALAVPTLARPVAPPSALSARAFPPYPSTCPVFQHGGFYATTPNCLIDQQIFAPAAFNAPITIGRSTIGLTVTPSVVRYGQRFTVTAQTSMPPCVSPDVPSVPSGCYNADTGFSGVYLRLLPLTNPEYVRPPFYTTVHQDGHCYSPKRCTFWFTRPQGPTDAKLTSHWIVALIQMTINLGVPQDVSRAGWLQNHARSELVRIETPIRLCAPSTPCPYQVSGKVTQQGPGGGGVNGVKVRAGCAGGGTTTTDAGGNYSFLLSPGRCPISVVPPAGLTVTPKRQLVHITIHNVAGVNFQTSCGDSSKAARAADSAPTCLDVHIKTIGPTRSGLALYRHFSPDDASRAFFLPPYSKQCASGCTNLLVTVTDAMTHQPVDGATVNASTTAVHGIESDGFLCDASAPKGCGAHVLGSTTDSQGQVHLLYWAPGLIKNETPTIRVTAKNGLQEGSGDTNFTVKPYLVYQHTGTLTRHEAEELAYWAAGKNLVSVLGRVIGGLSNLEQGLTFSLNAFIGAEVAAARAVQILEAVETVTPIVGVLEVAHLGSELWERQGFTALLLGKDALDLSPIGLADNPVERFVSAAPSAAFQNALANLGTVAPFHVGAGGVLWEYASHLAFLFEHHDVAFGAQFVHVKVYEVSYCQQGELCGPGYRNYLAGIQPRLYIVVSADRNRRAQSFGPHAFTIPYDPNAWAEAQANLQGLSG